MKKTWRNLALTMALAAAVFACSGGSEGEDSAGEPAAVNEPASGAPTPAPTDAPAQTPVPPTTPEEIVAAQPEAAAEPPQTELDRSEPADTPTGVVEQYMARLTSGDFEGAYLLCDQKSAHSRKLRGTIEGLENVRVDAEGLYSATKNLLVNGIKNVRWEKIIEDDEHAVYMFWKAGDEPSDDPNSPHRFEVWRIDGVWRVVPPKGGMPLVD